MTGITALLVASSIMLLCLVAGSLLIAQGAANERTLQQRLARVSDANFVQIAEKASTWSDSFKKHRKLLFRVLSLFNVDQSRAPDYPVPWWLALIASLLVTRGLIFLLKAFIDGPLILSWPFAALFLSRSVFSMFHRRRASSLFRQFPDALGTIVRCVRVGIPVQESLRIVSRDMPEPTAKEFSRLADKVAIGVSLEAALHELADRCQLAEYKFFATALSLQARTGGPLAQTLETLADVIRKRVAMRARGYALASEARTSALILGVLPIFAGAAIWLLQPSYIDALFQTPAGHKIFGAAVLLLSIGAFSMKNIIHRSLN